MNADAHLDFNDGVAGQGADAYCGADVLACFSEELHEEVRDAVDDRWGIFEAGDGVDVAVDGDDFCNGIKRAEFTLEHGELREGAGTRGVVAVSHAAVEPDSAGHDTGGVCGDDAGEEDEIAYALGGEVVAAGRGRRRQRDVESFELGFRRHLR